MNVFFFHLLLSFILGILVVFDRGPGAFEQAAKCILCQIFIAIYFSIVYYSPTRPQ